MDFAHMTDQALHALVRATEEQNTTPRGAGGGKALTEEAKRKITAELRRRAAENSQR